MARSFLTNINLNKNELQNAAIQALSTAPSNPTLGQIYYDINEANLRQWDGTQWLSYVTSDGSGQFINAVGSNLVVTSGNLTLGGKVVIDDAAQALTNKTLGAGNSLSASLNANSNTITNIPTPVNPGDAANKGYVDATAQGLNVKESVVTAATTNYDLTTVITDPALVVIGGWGGPGLAWGSRVLLIGQTDPTQNGIYVISQTAQGLVRAADQLIPEQGDFVFVEKGTSATRGFIIQTANISGIYWTQFSAAGEYVAGSNIAISGNTISFDGVLPVAHGGTGGTTAAEARAGIGATAKYSANNPILVSSNGEVSWSISHNLNTSDVVVRVAAVADLQASVEVDVKVSNSNTVVLTWKSGNVDADTYRVVIVG